jgi:PAS domain S-box-containing protein
MGDGFSIVDANGLHVDANPAFCEMTGFSLQELIGSRPEHCYWPPEEREQIELAISNSLRGETNEIELIFMRKDGGRFPVLVNPFAVRDHRGEISNYAATVRHVSRQVQMQVAPLDSALESELRYRALFENAGEAIMILKDDQVIDCNKQALKLTGRSRSDILSNPTVDYFPPRQPNGEDSRQLLAERIEASRSGVPQIFEWTGCIADGTTINTEVTLTSFMHNNTRYTQSIIRDITQRKKLEDALRDSEIRYRTLFENAGDAISINKNSRTLDCNRRVTEMYGFSREEILSATLGDFFPPTQANGQDSREYFQEKVAASRSGVPQFYEWTGRKRDGNPLNAEITLTSFVLGDAVYEQAIARDVTQRKQMEATLVELNSTLESRVKLRTDELEKTNAELLQRTADFRALAAKLIQAEHEERKRIARFLHDNQQQLLVAAKLRAEILQTDTYGPEANKQGRNLLEILEQAIEVSRTLTMELAPPVLYGAGLVVAIQWLAKWMKEHHHLDVAVIGDLPVTPLPTDLSILVFQVVRELLLNVFKHSGVKASRVTLSLTNQELVVAVTDEGIGFNVEAALESPRSMGLFGIQERLSLLGGRLTITSHPGHGTTNMLSVPVADPPPLQPLLSVAENGFVQKHVQHEHRGIIRVLVVDDHAGAREGVVQVLGLMEDFLVVGQAVDGLDAIEKAGQLLPDVVLMDMTMPRLSGLEATHRLTLQLPGIRVIGFSMHAREQVQAQWLEAGAWCYLQKNRPVEELISAIRAAMSVQVP